MSRGKTIGLMAIMALFGGIAEAADQVGATTAAVKMTTSAVETPSIIPTVAVLPFENRLSQDGVGNSIAELLTVKLSESGELELADRGEINKIMGELKLSESGLVNKETQLKIGQMIGAKIIVTGSVFRAEGKNYVVVKVIGVETSRVFGCSVSGLENPVEMTPTLNARILAVIQKNVTKLLPPVSDRPSVLEELKKQIGSGNGKTVYVKISEQTALNVDPAAEIELQKLLQELGFKVEENPDRADFRLTGEGIAEHSGEFKGFFSATARLELHLHAKEILLVSDRQVETVAGASANVAAKNALAQAALMMAKRIVPHIK